MGFRVCVELDAPMKEYDVGRVAAAVGLAMSDYEGTADLVVNRIDVEREDA